MIGEVSRNGNADRASPSHQAAARAACIGIIALTLASCAKDVPQRVDRFAERQLQPIPSRGSEAPRPYLYQRTSDIQRTIPRETSRSEGPVNTSKPRLPLATSASPWPRPRGPEKLNVGPLTPNQKERLFEEFLQWQKRTTIQGVLAEFSGTSEMPRSTSKAPLPLTMIAAPSSRPRGAEKLNEGPLSQTQKERLFEDFLQWQESTVDPRTLAMTDER